MILFDVALRAHAGQEAALADLLRRTMAGSAAEAGCLRYRFTRDLDDPAAFHLIELWADEPALMAHARGAAFRGFLAALPTLGSVVRSEAWNGDLSPYRFVRPTD